MYDFGLLTFYSSFLYHSFLWHSFLCHFYRPFSSPFRYFTFVHIFITLSTASVDRPNLKERRETISVDAWVGEKKRGGLLARSQVVRRRWTVLERVNTDMRVLSHLCSSEQLIAESLPASRWRPGRIFVFTSFKLHRLCCQWGFTSYKVFVP